jgi:hypothetical protein
LKSVTLNRRVIEEVTSYFIDDILDSMDAFPDVVRSIVKLFCDIASAKFP